MCGLQPEVLLSVGARRAVQEDVLGLEGQRLRRVQHASEEASERRPGVEKTGREAVFATYPVQEAEDPVEDGVWW